MYLSCYVTDIFSVDYIGVTLKHALRVVQCHRNGTIRKLWCGFLFAFHSNYGPILYRFGDKAVENCDCMWTLLRYVCLILSQFRLSVVVRLPVTFVQPRFNFSAVFNSALANSLGTDSDSLCYNFG